MLDEPPKLDDFADKIGQAFAITDAALPLELILTEAVAMSAAGLPPEFPQPFMLSFMSKGGPVLPQRLYRLEHPLLGAKTLFLVPYQQDAQGVGYCATIN